jgi:HAD superfamily hydrolase (TIGR01509 family)
MVCRGIIFDFNGTLVFDTQAHEEAWRQLIPTLRGTGFSEEEFEHHVHGHTNREIFSYVFGRDLSQEEGRAYGELKEDIYRRQLLQNPGTSRLVPGAEAFFDLLKSNEIPMAIATAAPAENIAFYRGQFGLDRWFPMERIIYADGTLPGKPHPALFNRAVERLGIPASECIIVEDSTLGIRAAQAACAGRIIGIYPDDDGRITLGKWPLFRLIPDYLGLDMSVFE